MGKKRKDKAVPQASRENHHTQNAPVIHDSRAGFINWKHLLLIAILSFGVYANTLSMDFALFDDHSQIIENDKIKSLSNVISFFTTEVWAGIRGATSSYYRPLFTLSLAIDYFFWGEQPFGYHLTNILLHLLAVSALYCLALKLLEDSFAAFFAAALFTVHPVHAEAVAWISGRNEMLSAIFMFSSFYFYINYSQTRKAADILSSLALFFLALLSKEMAITLPLVILAYEFCYKSGKVHKKLLFPAIFAFSVIPYMAVRLAVLKDIGLPYSQPLLWRLSTSPGLIIENLKHLIFPFNLKVLYDIPVKKIFIAPEVIIPLLALLVIFSGIVMLFKSGRKVSAFPLLFLFVSMLPISGLPAILLQPAPVADRYLYIPSAGFTIAAGYGLSALLALSDIKLSAFASLPAFLKRFQAAGAAGAVIVAVLFFLNYQRNYIWKDKSSLMHAMVKDAPNSPFARYSLGIAYESAGRLDNAAIEFRRAVELQPDYVEARNNLGIVYDQLGRTDDALKEYLIILKINPGNIRVRNNLGMLYEKRGETDNALSEYLSAVRLDSTNVHAFSNLGLLYRKLGRLSDSVRAFKAAIALKGSDPILHNNIGTVYLMQQSFDAAMTEFRHALTLKPDYADAHNNLGLAYRRLNRLEDAEGEFQKAIMLNQRSAEAHNNLGIVFSLQGKTDKAIAEFEIAVRIGPENMAFRENLAKALKENKVK